MLEILKHDKIWGTVILFATHSPVTKFALKSLLTVYYR